MPKIQANNINLYYEIHGQGQPVVFVAGFSGDHTAWQNTIADFAKNYQVIVFDNRGIGQSDCPDYPYTIEMMADDAAGLVKALQLGPAHFIGHSGGGYIVQNIVYKYPDLVKSAVIANAFNKMDVLGVLYAKTRLEMIQAEVPDEFIVKFITMLCWSKKYLSRPGKFEQLVQGGFYPITLQGYKHQLNAMINFDSSSWVSAIKKPCLVIGADEDLLASAKQVEQMAATIPNAEYFCFKDVGHVPMVEQPKVFNRLVLDFISKRETI